MNRFSGSVVVVTGAGSGIGAATAIRFAREGALVVVSDISLNSAKDVAAAIVAETKTARSVYLDVSDAIGVDDTIRALGADLGRIDVLVNNAGIMRPGPFQKSSVESFKEHMAVNVEGIVNLTRSALPYLRESSAAAIVNVSSISGLGGDYDQAAYATSKGAVTNLTRCMALDLSHLGIRVNAVCPGAVNTPAYRPLMQRLGEQTVLAALANTYPSGRIGEPDEIAGAIAFLASSDASFINGVALPVDGGLTAWVGAPRFNSI